MGQLPGVYVVTNFISRRKKKREALRCNHLFVCCWLWSDIDKSSAHRVTQHSFRDLIRYNLNQLGYIYTFFFVFFFFFSFFVLIFGCGQLRVRWNLAAIFVTLFLLFGFSLPVFLLFCSVFSISFCFYYYQRFFVTPFSHSHLFRCLIFSHFKTPPHSPNRIVWLFYLFIYHYFFFKIFYTLWIEETGYCSSIMLIHSHFELLLFFFFFFSFVVVWTALLNLGCLFGSRSPGGFALVIDWCATVQADRYRILILKRWTTPFFFFGLPF